MTSLKPETRDTDEGSTWFQMIDLVDPVDYQEKRLSISNPVDQMIEMRLETDSLESQSIDLPLEDSIDEEPKRRTRSSLLDSAMKYFS